MQLIKLETPCIIDLDISCEDITLKLLQDTILEIIGIDKVNMRMENPFHHYYLCDNIYRSLFANPDLSAQIRKDVKDCFRTKTLIVSYKTKKIGWTIVGYIFCPTSISKDKRTQFVSLYECYNDDFPPK